VVPQGWRSMFDENPKCLRATGYYSGLGLGGIAPDLNAARKWYQKAVQHQ